MSEQRQVKAEVAWRTAKNLLGRMACVYADPTRDGHDHHECLRDDESFIADRMLNLLNAVCRDDTDASLAGLLELESIITHKRAT